MQTQPPKSPDLNVLDLSFFRALQSHQWRSGFANNINELVAQVQLAFVTFESRKLDFAFLTLQHCIDDILAIQGDNNYSIRHVGKQRMLADGTLPVRVPVSANALEVYNLLEGDGRDANAGDVGNGDAAQAVQMIQNAEEV